MSKKTYTVRVKKRGVPEEVVATTETHLEAERQARYKGKSLGISIFDNDLEYVHIYDDIGRVQTTYGWWWWTTRERF